MKNDFKSLLNRKVPMPVGIKPMEKTDYKVEDFNIEDVGEQAGPAIKGQYETLFGGIQAKAVEAIKEQANGTQEQDCAGFDDDEHLELNDLNEQGANDSDGPILGFEEQARLFLNLWEELRKTGHLFAWRKFIDEKEARKLRDQLIYLQSPSDEQQALKVKLIEYFESLDKEKTGYIAGIPYTEANKEAAIIFFKAVIPKLFGSGNMSLVAIAIIIFVLPEAIMAVTMWNVSMSKPELPNTGTVLGGNHAPNSEIMGKMRT